VCQGHTGRLTEFWFLLKPAWGLNTNEWMNTVKYPGQISAGGLGLGLRKGLFLWLFVHIETNLDKDCTDKLRRVHCAQLGQYFAQEANSWLRSWNSGS
jgi:hypothetical protein